MCSEKSEHKVMENGGDFKNSKKRKIKMKMFVFFINKPNLSLKF